MSVEIETRLEAAERRVDDLEAAVTEARDAVAEATVFAEKLLARADSDRRTFRALAAAALVAAGYEGDAVQEFLDTGRRALT